MNAQAPIFSDVARWFAYPVLTQGINGTVTIPTAGGTGYGYVTLRPDDFFVFTNFRASTNYDNFVSDGIYWHGGTPQAPATLLPFVPNNFLVELARGQNSTYSSDSMTQQEIASSGYTAGKQLPIPVVYGPRFNFAFTFTDTTGLFLSTGDGSTPLALQINMYMEGYTVPISKWAKFLNSFPALNGVMEPPATSNQ